MRSYPPFYTIRIESPAGSVGTILHKGALAPLIADLLDSHDDVRARLEATDARTYQFCRKPRGVDPLPDPDDFGGL